MKVEKFTAGGMDFLITKSNEGYHVIYLDDPELVNGPFRFKNEALEMINEFVDMVEDDL